MPCLYASMPLPLYASVWCVCASASALRGTMRLCYAPAPLSVKVSVRSTLIQTGLLASGICPGLLPVTQDGNLYNCIMRRCVPCIGFSCAPRRWRRKSASSVALKSKASASSRMADTIDANCSDTANLARSASLVVGLVAQLPQGSGQLPQGSAQPPFRHVRYGAVRTDRSSRRNYGGSCRAETPHGRPVDLLPHCVSRARAVEEPSGRAPPKPGVPCDSKISRTAPPGRQRATARRGVRQCQVHASSPRTVA